MEKLLDQLEQRAINYYGGHYTIFRFTTNWKVCLGTAECRDDIEELEGFKTLKEAIVNCLLNDLSI
jgi:hypothetical protein